MWGTGRRAGEANVTEGLGVDPPTPVDAWGAMAIGLLVYLILEANVKSRALYQRRKTHNSPDAESTLASLVTVKDADADENNNTDYGYGDGDGDGYKAGESPRKQSQYMPPQAATLASRRWHALSLLSVQRRPMKQCRLGPRFAGSTSVNIRKRPRSPRS